MTQLTACGFYALRRAVLPVATLESVHAQPSLDGVYAQLRRVFAEPIWQEAIYIASPDFYQRFVGWLSGKQTDDADKIALTLYKYLVRMCTRCTPYGLFAGCATGTVADRTEVTFETQNKYIKFSRLDMEFLAELVESVLTSPAVQPSLRYVPNKMLYEIDNKYRYTERLTHNHQQSFRISSVDKSDYIDTVLKAAANGATQDELATSLADGGVPPDDAYAFVGELIEVQILVSALAPTITGNDFLTQFQNWASGEHPQYWQLGEVLRQMNRLLARQDTDVEKYARLGALASQIAHTQSPNRVQVDLFYNMSANTLGREAVTRITRQLEKLTVLARRHESPDLAAFRKRFCERYEQQEVPLHIALDNELGVGYSALQHNIGFQPLLDDIIWPENGDRRSMSWGALHSLVCHKYVDAIEKHRSVIKLTDADLAALRQEAPALTLPGSLYAFGSLLAASAEAIDHNEFLFNLLGCAGPSSASMLGRFCQGDSRLADLVSKALADEESRSPEAVFAEVVHLPETRVGNVIRRPLLRKYEIPYLTDSGLDADHQLPISDLRISIREGGRVVLRSVKLNREVIPRLTTAHNFSSGLPIYRFLCDLQYQDAGMSLGWDWGMLTNQTFLPRVQYGNIIISRATWNLAQSTSGAAEQELTWLLADLKNRYHLPQYVVIVQGDNEQLIDTTSPISLDLLQTEFTKRSRLVLKEYLFTADNRFLTDELGSYANELVLPLKTTVAETRATLLPLDLKGQIQRKFPLGSEWLFVKIYAGEKITETILSQFIRPLVEQLNDENLIDKWFFIRYADPEPHLRLRFHGVPEQNFFLRIIDYINTISHDYVQNHVIVRIQYDTYNREVERYGENTIEYCEELFYYDSEAVLAMIETFSVDDETEQQRWLVAIRGVDELLTDAGYTLGDRLKLMDELQQLFLLEFGDSPDLRRQLNQKYRFLADVISESLAVGDEASSLDVFLSVFRRRSGRQAPLLASLVASHGRDTLTALMPSLIHMHLNRLFFANQRSHELVIYHFLRKYYASVLARSKPRRSALS